MPQPHPATSARPLPDISAPFTLPFYYSSLYNCEVYYLVPLERVAPFLANTVFAPATFDGKAAVGYDYQLYTGQFSGPSPDAPDDQWPTFQVGVTQELELNIVVYPKALAAEVATVTFEQFVFGDEQSKLLGHVRVFLPCDDPTAIGAGEKLFGEPKFQTTIRANLPSDNGIRKAGSAYAQEWVETWGFRIDDPTDSKVAIMTCRVDLRGLTSRPAGASPLTEYGAFNKTPIGCRWNILQPHDTYMLADSEAKRVRLTLGASTHDMRRALHELIGDTPARAVRTIRSANAAIQNRAYFF